jgi:hypothetical protein
MKKQALIPTPMAVAGIPYPAREAPHGERTGGKHVGGGSDEDEGSPRGLFIAQREAVTEAWNPARPLKNTIKFATLPGNCY